MTKKKIATGYLAIEDNGVEVWSKALVEAVYVTCSEEMQRLKKVGTEKVVKMIPVCYCSHYVRCSSPYVTWSDMRALQDQRAVVQTKGWGPN
jgi:hypothetical protein